MDDYFACVRFIDDLKTNQVVSVKEIKYNINDVEHIKPETVNDFDSQHEYEVLWCLCSTNVCTDQNNEKCMYYKAYIVCLAETSADAEEKGSGMRFRLPRKICSPSDQTKPPSSIFSQTNSQNKNSSTLNRFNEKLSIKLDNVIRSKAIDAAKRKASEEQLSHYGAKQFMASRKSFQLNSSPNAKKGRTSNQEEYFNKSDDEEVEPTNPGQIDPLQLSNSQDFLGLDLSPNDPLQEINEDDAPEPLGTGGRRVQVIRKPLREVRPREAEPDQMSADERAINLYITPEAVEVDPRDRQKYQVFNNMIYLGEGKAVNKDFWDFLKLRGDSLFVRETAELICDKHNLVNRCIKEKKTSVFIQGRSPRKAISPRKYFLIRELFQDYLTLREYDKKTRNKLLSTFNRQIGYKIQDLRKALFK